MKDVIIIDLDGTLCNDAHRDHLAKAGEWDEYNALCHRDTPHEDVSELLRMVPEDVTVLAITGRNEKYRSKTLDWFFEHNINNVDVLLMRPDDDYTKMEECKIKLMENWFAETYGLWFSDPTTKDYIISRIKFVIDDRDRMVEAYRNYGLPCWQVRAGG